MDPNRLCAVIRGGGNNARRHLRNRHRSYPFPSLQYRHVARPALCGIERDDLRWMGYTGLPEGGKEATRDCFVREPRSRRARPRL